MSPYFIYRSMRYFLSLVFSCFILNMQAQLHKPFTIQAIEIEGLQNVSQDSVLNHIALKPGNRLHEEDIINLMQTLYNMNCFEDVRLERLEKRLKIKVKEGPIIQKITLTPQTNFPVDSLEKLLKQKQIVAGEFFNLNSLEHLKKILQFTLEAQGKYNAKISHKIEYNAGNTVSLTLDIKIGPTLNIESIRILGNKMFTDSTLLNTLPITTSRWWGLLTGRFSYYNQQVKQLLKQALTDFYNNHGYYDMFVVDEQMTFTPDRTAAYWNIRIEEGALYRIRNYRLFDTEEFDMQELQRCIKFQSNQLYSKEKILETEEKIKHYLSHQGYLFAKVEIIPYVDRKHQVVDLSIKLIPGMPIYIRKIHLHGNQQTKDRILRNLIPQQEYSLASSRAIGDAQVNLEQSKMVEVSNIDPQMISLQNYGENRADLHINVKESPSFKGSFGPSASINGFSWAALSIDFPLELNNFLGTGKNVGFQLQKLKYDYILTGYYDNPYFNLEGVRQRFEFYVLGNHTALLKLLQETAYYWLDSTKFTRALSKYKVDSATSLTTSSSTATSDEDSDDDSSKKKQRAPEMKEDNLNFLQTLTNPEHFYQKQRAPEMKEDNLNFLQKLTHSEHFYRTQYNFNRYGFSFSASYPIDAFGNRLSGRVEARLSNLSLPERKKDRAKEVIEFINSYQAERFFQLLIDTDYIHDKRKGMHFPVGGSRWHALKLKLSLSPHHTVFNYWKFSYNTMICHALSTKLTRQWELIYRFKLQYGNGLTGQYPLPFFENAVTGNVCGYARDDFGPKDSLGHVLGGNFSVMLRAAILFPQPLRNKQFRTSAFIDAGQIYNQKSLDDFNHLQLLHTLKFSMGLTSDIIIRLLGYTVPFNVSLAFPVPFIGAENMQCCNVDFSTSFY